MFHNKPKPTPVLKIEWQTVLRQALRRHLNDTDHTCSSTARATGLSRKTIHRFASGISDLQPATFQILAEYLGFELHRKAQ